MPKRKFNGNGSNGRTRKRTKRRTVRVVKMPNVTLPRRSTAIPVGMPDSKWVRLRYATTITLNAPGVGITGHNFRCNSLFDPDETGVGHQPMHWDQVIIPYEKYTVYGSKIRMTQVKSQATVLTPGIFGIFLDDNTTRTYTNAPAILESNQRSSKWSTTSGLEQIGRSVSIGFSAKKFFGVTNLDGSNFKTASVSNPVDDAIYHCWVANIGGNDPSSAVFLIEIEYLAKLGEKKFVAQS